MWTDASCTLVLALFAAGCGGAVTQPPREDAGTARDAGAPVRDAGREAAAPGPDAGPGCAVQLVMGSSHGCLRTAGGAWCWGRNVYGELGDGTTTDRPAPVPVSGLGSPITQLAAGLYETCALGADGSAWCWGNNNHGQVGDGTKTSRSTPTQVSALSDAQSISVGFSHACAVRKDGTLSCWGENGSGQLGDGTTANASQPVQVAALGTDVAQVAAGTMYTCAIRKDGSLWCWGDNSFGQLGDGTIGAARGTPAKVEVLGSGVASVTNTGSHACARKTDDSVWCWGFNNHGQLGTPGPGSVPTPKQVALGKSTVGVASGIGHTCALAPDGSASCWGFNLFGQLGDGTMTDRTMPTPVAASVSFAEIAAAGTRTCGRTTDGATWCWGGSPLGNGTDARSTTPVPLGTGCL